MKKLIFALLLLIPFCLNAEILDYYCVTQAGSGGANGSDWDNSMSESGFETQMEGSALPGEVYFLRGNFTLDSDINWSARDANEDSAIAIIGVKSSTTNVGANVTCSDYALDYADRPVITMSTYNFNPGDFTLYQGLNFTGEDLTLVLMGSDCTVRYCDFYHSQEGGVSESALSLSNRNIIEKVTIRSESGNGLIPGNYCKIKYCIFGPCTSKVYGQAIALAGASSSYFGCIFKKSHYGVFATSDDGQSFDNCTFWKCDTAIREVDGMSWSGSNIIIDSCDAGIVWTTQKDNNRWSNILFNEVTSKTINVDTTTIFRDCNRVAGDPLLVDPNNDNFRIGTGSPAKDVGLE